jgi:asparagine synthase (glutamine-hydrolysing)
MCGIAGFTSLRTVAADPDRIIREMAATLVKRGPDGEGFHHEPGVTLGHRRLSIIDIEGGAQPMETADGRYWTVYNGEIYNYVELRRDLEAAGRVFRTRSDTEVLLQQFAQDGAAALQKLNGIFAFAIWDRERRRLFLARDRLGVKPLYYFVSGGELVFASELKALLRHPAVSREINLLSVSKYLSYGFVPAPNTIFLHVRKLEPGTWLEFDEAGLRKDLYWDIPLEDNPIGRGTVDECAEDLLRILRDSVRGQLRSDVPVGVFLSGGIDSSTITALASQWTGGELHTFSVGFEESSYDEAPYAAEVARRYRTRHHHEVLSQRRAVGLLPEVLAILDEPLADASILPTYLLSQFTAEHVKVVLGGDGGDELFLGYPAFQAHRLMEKISFLPAAWRDQLVRLARRLPVSHRYASLEFLVQQFFKGAGLSPEIRFFLWLGYCGNDQKRMLLTETARTALLRQNPFEDILGYVHQSGLVRDFERIQYLCMKLYLQDGILVKVDRASMANSLEVRVPLLDHNLVEYAAGISPMYKLRGFTPKYVFRRAVQGLLPRRITHRRKAGFMIPLAAWIERDLRGLIEDACAPATLKRDGFFDPVFVRKILDEHFAHERDHRKVIWSLFCFQVWMQHYGRG